MWINMIGKDLFIQTNHNFTFHEVIVEQKKYMIDPEVLGNKTFDLPILEITINNKPYYVGKYYWLLITLSNGEKIYWCGEHNLVYAFFFEHYRHNARDIIRDGGMLWRHFDAHDDVGGNGSMRKVELRNEHNWTREISRGTNELSCGNFMSYIAGAGIASIFDWIHNNDGMGKDILQSDSSSVKTRLIQNYPQIERSAAVFDLDVDLIVGLNPDMPYEQMMRRFWGIKDKLLFFALTSDVIFIANSSELFKGEELLLAFMDPLHSSYCAGTFIKEMALQSDHVGENYTTALDLLPNPA